MFGKKKNVTDENQLETMLPDELLDPDELDAMAKKPKKKLPNWVIFVILGGIVAIAVGGQALAGGSKKTAAAANAVTVYEVETGDVAEVGTASGLIDSENKKIVYSPVNAKIAKCNVVAGQRVKSGDKIIEFDTTKLEQDNQSSQMSLLQTQQANQEAYAAAERAASSMVEAANASAQAACDAANQLADQVDAQGAVCDQVWAEYNAVAARLEEAKNNSLTAEQKKKLEDDQKELALWKDSKAGTYTEAYFLLDADITSTQKALTEATAAGNADEIEKAKQKNADAMKKKDDTDKRIAALETEITSIEATISGPIAAAQTEAAAAQEKAKAQDAAYSALYAQWQTAYNAAQNANTGVDTSSANVTASQQTQMQMSSNAAQLQAMTAAQLVEAGKNGLSAEFDGVVSEVQAVTGLETTQGAPLYTLADTGRMIVEIEVSTNDYAKYFVGQEATVTVGSHSYNAQVSKVNGMATNNAKGNPVVLVTVKLMNVDENLIIGAKAKISMKIAEVKDALYIPTEALNVSSDGNFVYVLEDGKVKETPITIGISSDNKIEVTKGLKAGDKVITDTGIDLQDGMEATEKGE